MPSTIEWHEASHPVPDRRSVTAAERALEIASSAHEDDCIVLLLSGGASAVMAAPIAGLSLETKQDIVRTMLLEGADIHALNTVRKHLSRIKGGHLAAQNRGTTLTLAISDVVGDDLSVIGSGPGVPDPSTWRDAAAALQRYGVRNEFVTRLVDRGLGGEIPETPKAGDPAMARAHAFVIASRQHAIDAARTAAAALGYDVAALGLDVTGEAREAAPAWLDRALKMSPRGRVCVLSAGETTVHVTGSGRGGRNQEFALALTHAMAAAGRAAIVASVGTDGIDGPTDAAGALVDATTLTRATALGLDHRQFLDDNNAYDFFALLGDLIHLGRTDTNVGDLQVLLTVEN
jgi:hydroxypyruvate reductase